MLSTFALFLFMRFDLKFLYCDINWFIVFSAGVVKQYAWGKGRNESAVYHLHSAQERYSKELTGDKNSASESATIHAGAGLDGDAPYAELWLTTHPSGTATVPTQNSEDGKVATLTSIIEPLGEAEDVSYIVKVEWQIHTHLFPLPPPLSPSTNFSNLSSKLLFLDGYTPFFVHLPHLHALRKW